MKEHDTVLNFWNEVKRKLSDPWKEAAFCGYFALTIILAAVAIITPLTDVSSGYIQVITASISTFFIASIVSSTIDLNLSFDTINKASFSIYTILALIISIVLFALNFILTDYWRLIPSIAGFIVSIIIWIIANSEKDIVNDKKHAKKLADSVAKTNNYSSLLSQISESDG